MPNIKGTWQWDDNPQVNVPSTIDQNVNFTSNGENFERIEIRGFIRYYYAGEHDPEYIDVTATATWTKSDYKYLDFGATDQTVDDDFYSFIEENAAPYMSVQIGAVYPVTLLTRDKYVDKNIRVLPPPADEPVLEEKTVTPNDEIQVIEPSQGYDALSKVTVNAVPTEEKTATPTEQQQLIEPSEGQYLSSVTVEAIEATEKSVTANGEYTPDTGTYYKKVNVNVPQYTDISSTTAQADDVLEGEYFFPYNGAPRTEGAIPVRTASNPEFTSKNDSVTFQEGYYPEASTVKIAESEKEKIIPENIKDGEVILGVTGSYAGGGLDINGAINEYVVNAGANVNAGDFVEFITKWGAGNYRDTAPLEVKAAKIDNERVAIAYYQSETVYLKIIRFDGNEMLVGNEITLLSAERYTSGYWSFVAFGGKFLGLAFYGGQPRILYMRFYRVDAMTAVSVKGMTSTAATAKPCIAAANGKILVFSAYDGHGATFLYNYDDTTVTYVKKTNNAPNYRTDAINDCTVTPSGKFVCLHREASTLYLAAVTVDESNNISVGGRTNVTYSGASWMFIRAINDTYLLLAGNKYAQICSLSANTIIKVSNPSSIPSVIWRHNYESDLQIINSETAIAVCDPYKYAYYLRFNVSTGQVTAQKVTLTRGYSQVPIMNTHSAIGINRSEAYIVGLTFDTDNSTIEENDVSGNSGTFVQPATTRDGYVGVAKTGGTAGQTVEVYDVPLSYAVTVSKTNCTNTSVTSPMKQSETQTITFTANTGYTLPETITVTNCEYEWSAATGQLTITNLTGNVQITVNATVQKLAAPVIALNGSVISWSAVANATSYGIFADNQPFGASTTGTSFDLADYEKAIGAGTKNITVNAQGSPYATSDASNAVSYTVIALSAPTLTWTAASGLLTWTASENAESYTVYEQISSSDWNEVTTTTATYASIDFDAGAHTMAVKATSTTKVDSALSNAVTVNVYGISTTLTGVTGASSNASKIYEGTSETLTFTADDGYTLPETITVTNAQYTWNNGTLTLSNPTGNVTVTITGVQEQTPLITNPLNGATITAGCTYEFASGFTPTTVKLNGITSSTSVTETIIESDTNHGVYSPDSTVNVSVNGNVTINAYNDDLGGNYTHTGELLCTVTFSNGSQEATDTFTAQGSVYYYCFVKGTKISLADGTVKNVEDIRYDDNLLVWDFDNARYASAMPLWIKQPEKALYYYKLTFESGRVLNVVGSDGNAHRLFSVDDNAFVYSTQLVGKRVYTENGIDTLKACERIEEEVEFYNIITKYHMNLFAENVLTSCRYSNLYPIKDMRYIREERDIIPYSAYNVPREYYDGLRLGEQKIKGSDTNKYVSRLIRGKL